ncbi:hypothetical protein HPP92_009598 [Vanilla planifolia]|uniref:Uncharacterized protein n=1 Tax=Vanilla planifolia TaxID=51239 RepID=A0A835RAW5_VANPL|nr:hypothetical protein HPP92_009598 [Vanilla planifolia]
MIRVVGWKDEFATGDEDEDRGLSGVLLRATEPRHGLMAVNYKEITVQTILSGPKPLLQMRMRIHCDIE